MLYVFNTFSRKKEKFVPRVAGKVGMYSCGPTVYWYQHIGNMRTYIFSDIVKRALLYTGLKVQHVMNVTDVGHLTSDGDDGEDKMELAASKEGKNASEIATHYFEAFVQDMQKLNILTPDVWCKATEHIPEQITLIRQLEKKGFTYTTSDGVYFDSQKFKKYGELAKLSALGLKEGSRVAMGEKRNKTDFALWKFSGSVGVRQQEWESPWGVGFPGWHIECSAMSMKYLKTPLDIHTGGIDHIPVHHTNEIAQSEGATGKKFVKYWMHGAFLTAKGEKVSKSKGGLYTVSELEQEGYSPLDFRYLCLLTHYRKSLDFTLEHLDAARVARLRIERKIIEIRTQKHTGADHTKKYRALFSEALEDDLNMPLVVQVFLRVLEDNDFEAGKKYALLLDFDRILGLNIREMREEKISVPKNVQMLIDEREKYRKNKDFVKADILRERIREEGFELEDKAGNVVVRKT